MALGCSAGEAQHAEGLGKHRTGPPRARPVEVANMSAAFPGDGPIVLRVDRRPIPQPP
jgi:hypothetical protein